jgi:hypothetical protein
MFVRSSNLNTTTELLFVSLEKKRPVEQVWVNLVIPVSEDLP